MSAGPLQKLNSVSVEHRVDELAAVLVAILEACNVDPRVLIDGLSASVNAEGDRTSSSPIWASSDTHLACTQVVFVWRRDPEFLDAQGNTRPLEESGDVASFVTLCERAAPGQSAEGLLTYLSDLGAVRRLENGTVELLTESVLACSARPQRKVAPETVLMHLQGFLGTVRSNLLRGVEDPPARFERACYGNIPERLVPVFQQLVAARGQNFIDSIDEWLDRHRARDGRDGETARVGAGAYMLLHNSNNLKE